MTSQLSPPPPEAAEHNIIVINVHTQLLYVKFKHKHTNPTQGCESISRAVAGQLSCFALYIHV